MVFAIQLVQKSFIAIISQATFFAFFKQVAELSKLHLVILEHSQPCPHYLTCRAIAAALKLFGYEVIEMFAKGNAGIFGHICTSFNTKYRYLMVCIHSRAVNLTHKAL